MADQTLSPSAQAVRRDLTQIMHQLSQRCRVSISVTDTLPIILETNGASLQAGINSLCAAALRAAIAVTQQHQGNDCLSDEIWTCDADELLAIAAELEGP